MTHMGLMTGHGLAPFVVITTPYCCGSYRRWSLLDEELESLMAVEPEVVEQAEVV